MATKNKPKKDVTKDFFPAAWKIKDIKLTDKQRDLVRIIRDENTKVCFIQGPSGSSKTFCAAFCGLLALREKSVKGIKFLRSLVESSPNKIGFLPGDIDDKVNVYQGPLLDQLDCLLDESVSNQLLEEKLIQTLPVNFLRGRGFKDEFIIIDESQNCDFATLQTILTRIGENSKFIFLGDIRQSDTKMSGFQRMIKLFDDDISRENGIHTFEFTSEDIMRSGILKFIVEKLETVSH